MFRDHGASNRTLAYLKNAYPYDSENNSFTIRISVEDYFSLFNVLDPTPFSIRDLSPDVIDFLNTCSNDIPLKYAVKLEINIGNCQKDDKLEQEIQQGFKHYFDYIVNIEQEKIRRSRSRMGKYVLMSFFFITCSALLSRITAENFMVNFLREGCLIGGWVFLWQAFDMNFIRMDEIKDALKQYMRLASAKVTFSYPTTFTTTTTTTGTTTG